MATSKLLIGGLATCLIAIGIAAQTGTVHVAKTARHSTTTTVAPLPPPRVVQPLVVQPLPAAPPAPPPAAAPVQATSSQSDDEGDGGDEGGD